MQIISTKHQFYKLWYRAKYKIQELFNKLTAKPLNYHELKSELYSINRTLRFLESDPPEIRDMYIPEYENKKNAILNKLEKRLPVWAVEANLPQ